MALFIALALSYLPDEYFWAHLEMTCQEESPEKNMSKREILGPDDKNENEWQAKVKINDKGGKYMCKIRAKRVREAK